MSGVDDAFYQGMLDSNQEFQDGDLGEAVLEGRCGFHAYYANEEPLAGTQTAMHKALNNTLEMVHLDLDRIEERHGEATPETVAAELGQEIEQTVGKNWFMEAFTDEFEAVLRKQVAEEQGGDPS